MRSRRTALARITVVAVLAGAVVAGIPGRPKLTTSPPADAGKSPPETGRAGWMSAHEGG